MNITHFNELDNDFINRINNFSRNEPFELFYLFNGVNMANFGQVNFYNAFIISDGNCEIIGFLIEGNFYLYGKNWKDEHLMQLKKIIDFKSFPINFHFVGTYDLINNLFTTLEISYEVFKDRFFYKITPSSQHKISNDYEISIPTIKNLESISTLFQKAHTDEYKGLIKRESEEFRQMAKQQILSSDIYIIKQERDIAGFCTTMHTDSPEPLIGNIYIKDEYRNLGLGKKLLYKVIEKLNKKYKSTYLVTERDNVAANKLFKSIGFFKIYEHLDIITVANNGSSQITGS